MWPFKKKTVLPGIERDTHGQITCKLTDEEEAEVRRFFATAKESGGEEGEGEWYIHPDAHNAMTAWALVGYAQNQVLLADAAEGVVVDRDLCLRKALAAATKAYSLHPLPIYMFGMACLLEMLGDNSSAGDAFRSFLKLHEKFKPTAVDEIMLRYRDVDAAVREARERMRA